MSQMKRRQLFIIWRNILEGKFDIWVDTFLLFLFIFNITSCN